MRAEGKVRGVWIAIGFAIIASCIALLREEVAPYRPGQWVGHDIVSRVDFQYSDRAELTRIQERRREAEPRVYKSNGDVWAQLDEFLTTLPARVTGSTFAQLSETLKSALDPATLGKLQEYAQEDRTRVWQESVHAYVAAVKALRLVIIPETQRQEELKRQIALSDGGGQMSGDATYSPATREELAIKFHDLAVKNFPLALQPQIVRLTLNQIKPTHTLDQAETTEARNLAATRVPENAAIVTVPANHIFVSKGDIDLRDYELLRAENDVFIESLGPKRWLSRLGLAGCLVILTIALAAYTARFQPRIVRNHLRAIAIAALLLSTMLLALLCGIGSTPIYVFAIAPTILVSMILAIAYDQRYAIGVSCIHAVLVTMAINAPLSFLLILWAGVATSALLLDDVRTRSKLIEVGGAAALAMIVTTIVTGLLQLDPWAYVMRNSLYAGAAGLACGFVVLGILPFIERSFKITTSMTLLELADVSHPLLRRLSVEAPGTYNHSLQVATLSEEAAESIGANGLLCRVASYYHDVGKINKPEYFVENQVDGMNRHLNLDPNLSFLIILGHVKDGIELAKLYNLPTSLVTFIQQHHGTTLVEYFYHRACTQHEMRDDAGPAISDTQYRYPGPKPKTREVAIVMLADAVESATRAMAEPTASRIESLVHDLAMKRLFDGQFDECDLTMRDIERAERSLVKTLLSIYHGRIAYPTTATPTQPFAPSVRTA